MVSPFHGGMHDYFADDAYSPYDYLDQQYHSHMELPPSFSPELDQSLMFPQQDQIIDPSLTGLQHNPFSQCSPQMLADAKILHSFTSLLSENELAQNMLMPIPGYSLSPSLESSISPTFKYESPGHGRRSARSMSMISSASSSQHNSATESPRATSPSASEMAKWGVRNHQGSWACSFVGCTSKSTFRRGCDLRKHYRRHTKSLFCRHPGCPQSAEGGFSSKKDRARHEAKHNPQIMCEWTGCDRLFSRVDNMKDHVRRIHRSSASKL